jgi:hypothetical protein
MPLRRRFKCYVGLGGTKAKLRMLLGRYRFDTCASVLGVDEGSRDTGVRASIGAAEAGRAR